VPITLAVSTIVSNAKGISIDFTSLESVALPAAPAWLDRVPIAGARAVAKWNAFAALAPSDRVTVLTPHVQTALQWFVGKAGSIGTMLLQFLLTAIIAAILFANGEIARNGILRFAERMAGRQGHDVAILAAQTIRSVVIGVVGTALIQTAIGGLGLFVSGVPAAALLTAVMFFFCLAQIGPIFVVGSAVAWLYWSGNAGRGTTMLVFAVVAVAIDNVIRPILIKRGANLPLVLIFGGVIGGLLAFGIIGLFVGPVVLAVAYTMIRAWVNNPPAQVY
jgi:predicted PurR-regulated permease PerM